MLGPPRSLPHVKHTYWVKERKPLEERKPKDCAEVCWMDAVLRRKSVSLWRRGSPRIVQRCVGWMLYYILDPALATYLVACNVWYHMPRCVIVMSWLLPTTILQPTWSHTVC